MEISLMGKMVVVSAVYRKTKERVEGKANRQLSYKRDEIKPRAGWLIGERYLPVGEVESGNGYDDPPCFHVKGKAHAYVVVFWPTLAPVYVPFDEANPAIRFHCTLPNAPNPLPVDDADRLRAAMRASYKNHPEQWPRDPKTGRFQGG